MTTRFVPVLGTWAFDGTPDPGADWWMPGSDLLKHLAATEGLEHARPDEPFVWCSGLDGVRGADAHWIAAAANLAAYLRALPYEDRNVVAHSHGGQVAILACVYEQGFRARTGKPIGDPFIRRLMTVCSPVRKDLIDEAQQAKPLIGSWLHVASNGGVFDKWQVLGELFDGRLGIYRAHPVADINDRVRDIGHSRILRDRALFPLWSSRRWAAFLRE